MNVNSEKIENLEELVGQYIETNKKVSDVKISRLTATGENFGSTILKVDLTLKDEKEKCENLSIVAKLLPESEFFQKIFDVQKTFKLESAFYGTIVPTLQEFQKERGIVDVIDLFPRFYGSRNNLDGGEKIDGNAVILLENLKVYGYQNLDRHLGCDLEIAKVILNDLAKLHALPIALKLLKPETFQEKIKVYLDNYHIQYLKEPNETIMKILEEDEECIPLLPKLLRSFQFAKTDRSNFREPFATIVHRDMWVNNFMVKFENGKVVKTKFVDFQNYTYESPIRDLLFYLFTSLQIGFLKDNLDDLIEFYHKRLVKSLEELQCPTDDFSYENLMDEIKYFGIYELSHIMFMMVFVVFGPKGDTAVKPEGAEMPVLPSKDQLPKEIKDRACFVLKEFGRRKWLEQ